MVNFARLGRDAKHKCRRRFSQFCETISQSFSDTPDITIHQKASEICHRAGSFLRILVKNPPTTPAAHQLLLSRQQKYASISETSESTPHKPLVPDAIPVEKKNHHSDDDNDEDFPIGHEKQCCEVCSDITCGAQFMCFLPKSNKDRNCCFLPFTRHRMTRSPSASMSPAFSCLQSSHWCVRHRMLFV